MKSLFTVLCLIVSSGLWFGQEWAEELPKENVYAVECVDQFGQDYILEYTAIEQYDFIEEFDLCLEEGR